MAYVCGVTKTKNMITTFKQIKAIIEPIPEDKFCTGRYRDDNGCSCFLGHIHIAQIGDHWGDNEGYGARELTERFLKEVHGLAGVSGARVNNGTEVNGYNQPVIKDRLMAMIEDGIKWEEGKSN